MKKIFTVLSIIVLSLPTASQNTAKQKIAHEPIDPKVQQEIDDTNNKLSALEKKLDSIESTLSFYKYLIDEKQTRYDTIQLDPSSHSFQRLDTDTSSFLISVEDVSPYLNGYRLKLSVGNPSNATFSGVKIKIKWGRSYDMNNFTSSTYKQWLASIQDKEVPLDNPLLPGTWNSVNLDLVPAAANELGYLEISMTSTTLSLRTN